MRDELDKRERTFGYGAVQTLQSATCLAMLLQARQQPEEAL